ncbi:MAG: hypothetical protein M1830_003675, partial [Pleopsidium flavum]
GSSTSSQPQQSGGLFGTSTQQNKPAGGLFGSLTNSPQAGTQSSGMFQPQANNTQGRGLFGGQSAQQQGGGLFGTQSNQQQGGGLFGSSNAQQSQPQQGGGLYGSLGQNTNQHQQQQQQQQQQQGGGLFGNLNNQNKSSSLFGNTMNQPQQNPQQTSSLFSNTTNMNTQAQAQAQAQQPQTRPSLFNTSLSMGQTTLPSAPQTLIPGVKIDVSQIRNTTRFSDLHPDLQTQIETIDNFILTQMHFKSECDSVLPKIESQSLYIPNDVAFVSRKLETMQQALENDAEAIDVVRKSVKRDAADAKLSFRAIDNLKLPQQYHYTGLWNVPSVSQPSGPKLPASPSSPRSPSSSSSSNDEGTSSDLISYFSTQADTMRKTLESYTQSIHDIESHLLGVETNTVQQMQQLSFTRGRDGGARSEEDRVRELAAVLREFENAIMAVAGKVGGAREGVTEVVLGGLGGMGRR